jgi:hypothetical protein
VHACCRRCKTLFFLRNCVKRRIFLEREKSQCHASKVGKNCSSPFFSFRACHVCCVRVFARVVITIFCALSFKICLVSASTTLAVSSMQLPTLACSYIVANNCLKGVKSLTRAPSCGSLLKKQLRRECFFVHDRCGAPLLSKSELKRKLLFQKQTYVLS